MAISRPNDATLATFSTSQFVRTDTTLFSRTDIAVQCAELRQRCRHYGEAMERTAEELRVLGCLIEKQATTPDHYPLTTNALVNA